MTRLTGSSGLNHESAIAIISPAGKLIDRVGDVATGTANRQLLRRHGDDHHHRACPYLDLRTHLQSLEPLVHRIPELLDVAGHFLESGGQVLMLGQFGHRLGRGDLLVGLGKVVLRQRGLSLR